MVKISQYPFSLYRFTTVLFFLVHHVDAQGSSSEKEFYSCRESASFYRCNDGQEHEISNKVYMMRDKSSGTAIEASGENTTIEGQNIIVNGISRTNAHSEESSWTTAVKASKKGAVSLSTSMFNNISIGADVNEGGAFEMQEGVIEATVMGVSAVDEGSFVFLSDTTITTQAGAISLLSHGKAKMQMDKGKIDFFDGIGVQVAGEGEMSLKNVMIVGKRKHMGGGDNKYAAFSVLQEAGALTFEKGKVHVVNSHGILLQGNESQAVQIKDSSVVVRNEGFHGMHFFWEGVFQGLGKTILPGKGVVHLKKTDFTVPESAALYSRKFNSSVTVSEGSKIFGDLLLKAEEEASVDITADASLLKGGAFLDRNSTAKIVLKNGSQWILSRPKHEKLQNFTSSVSSLHLEKSSLIFEKRNPEKMPVYQTLLIGKGKGKVYQAQEGAQLYLNTYLYKGGTLQEQETDRLLINGDVVGETTVHIYSAPESPGAFTGEGGNNQGISIIQAYGTAKENSFQLSGGYVTPPGSPYQYHLVAYGPSSSSGPADPAQKILKDAKTFWDFRLESKLIASPSFDGTDVSLTSSHTVSHPSAFPDTHSDFPEVEGTPINSDFETETEFYEGETVFPSFTASESSASASNLPSSSFDSYPVADAPVPVGFFPSEPVLISPSSRSFKPTVSSLPPTVSSTPRAPDPIASPSPTVPVSSAPRAPDPIASPSPTVPVSPTPRAPDPIASPSPTVPVSSKPRAPDLIASPSPTVSVSPTPRAPDPIASPSPTVPVSSTPRASDPIASPSPTVSVSSTPRASDPIASPSPTVSVSSTPRAPDPIASPSPTVPVSSAPRAPDPIDSPSSFSTDPKVASSFPSVIPVSAFVPHFKKSVRALVPQASTYLLLPNILSHAGFVDISNQNQQLEMQRIFSAQLFKMDKNPALFLRGYGSNHHYTSNLSALEYGYGGDVDYNAIEAGILLNIIENIYSTTSFGVMATYGKLSLQPQDVEQSQESIFKKWTVTAYSTMQHNTGLYMDTLLSYGLFQGDVFTLKRGKTAALRGKPLSISLTAGKEFTIGCRGFVFDPQIQFLYQHLQFHKTQDVDNFTIDMKNPDYWMMRIGGRFTKALIATEKSQGVSFYGKFHVLRDFSDKQHVYLGNSFLLGAFGSSLETGFGFSARLSPKIAFHSDLTYQHKLTKAGFSGTHFSGGLNYHF